MEWGQIPNWQKQKIRAAISSHRDLFDDGEVTHEAIEAACHDVIAGFDIEDDDHHVMVSEIYAEYLRAGGAA